MLGFDAFFGGPALRCLQKVEPLELHAGHDLEAHLLGALEHTLQGLARALGVRCPIGIDKLAQEKGHTLVPGYVARRVQVEPCQRVRKTMLPSRGCGVVVGAVHHVPAQHDITESEATARIGLGGAQELVAVQVFAAQDAVDVADGHLDFGRTRFLDGQHCRVHFCCVRFACHVCLLISDLCRCCRADPHVLQGQAHGVHCLFHLIGTDGADAAYAEGLDLCQFTGVEDEATRARSGIKGLEVVF